MSQHRPARGDTPVSRSAEVRASPGIPRECAKPNHGATSLTPLWRRALIVLVLSHLATQDAIAQPPTERQGPNGGAVAPRTPDGRPDLQGVWHYATATPLERLAEFADRPFVSEADLGVFLPADGQCPTGARRREGRRHTHCSRGRRVDDVLVGRCHVHQRADERAGAGANPARRLREPKPSGRSSACPTGMTRHARPTPQPTNAALRAVW